MPEPVAIVLSKVEVQTCKEGKLRALICLANDSAYFCPRGDRAALPPILPMTLYSLSPCYKRIIIDVNSKYHHFHNKTT